MSLTAAMEWLRRQEPHSLVAQGFVREIEGALANDRRPDVGGLHRCNTCERTFRIDEATECPYCQLAAIRALAASSPEQGAQEADCYAVLTPNGSKLVSPEEAKGLLQAYPLYRAAPASPGMQWVSVTERSPFVPLGKEKQFWVCAERQNGKRYVYTLWFVNKPVVDVNDPPDWAVNNEDYDAIDCVGWHEVGANSSFDEFYLPAQQEHEIIAWMPMVKPNPPLTASQEEVSRSLRHIGKRIQG